MVDQNNSMTVPEAAETLGYTVQHTRLLLRRGRLRGNKIGRDWIVLRESVAEYNVRRASIPLLPSSSKKGRRSIGEREHPVIRPDQRSERGNELNS